jgi:hypothetical protein
VKPGFYSIVALCLALPCHASAEEISGFYPGFWGFPDKPAITDADISAACRSTLVIVTPPNNAETIVFEPVEGAEAANGKTLRGKLIYVENCPEIQDGKVVCAGRDPSAKELTPTFLTYKFKKQPNGHYAVIADSKNAPEVTFYPRLCPAKVIDELKKTAIMPEGVSLDR